MLTPLNHSCAVLATTYVLITAIALSACSGCGLPWDPEATLENARDGRLRVGVIANPPYTTVSDPNSADSPGGIEVEIVTEIAASLESQIEWVQGGPDQLFQRLEKYELDLVIGGIQKDSPWRQRVGMTSPWDRKFREGDSPLHVFAISPGENGWLIYLDRWLKRHSEVIRSSMHSARQNTPPS